MASFDVVEAGALILRGSSSSDDVTISGKADLIAAIPVPGILGTAVVRHATVDTTVTTTSTVSVDLDAANLAVTFTVPASGKVVVSQSAYGAVSAGAVSHVWSVRSGAADVAKTAQSCANSTQGTSGNSRQVISGLTPGAVLTYKWGWRVSAAGSAYIHHGPTYGALVMEVWAA